jgi:dTDP-4-amino-4,6-dideoxygalactose transaminase
MSVPLIDVQAHRGRIGDQIDDRIAQVVEHGKYIMGPEVAEFEQAMAAWIGDPTVQAIGCANGTDALVLAVQALGLEVGQAVVCPSFTFIATAEAVAILGGVPVFADVAADDFNLDSESARHAVKSARAEGLDVVGMIAVDLFGQPADYSTLRTLCDELGLWLIADAAQSFGGSSSTGRVGSLADITTTSFFPAKPLGCYGDGGALFTADSELAEAIRSLRVHGKGTDKYDNVRIGQNSRLDTLQAAILLPKLAILADELDARDVIANRYEQALADWCLIPRVKDGSRSAWAQYTIRCDDRDGLQKWLGEAGVGTAVYYPTPLHLQTAYRRYHQAGVALPVSDQLADSVLSLPMYPYLSEADQNLVIELCIEYLREEGRKSA